MYLVSIQLGATSTPIEIQNEHYKLFSGSVVQGINAIDSFTFSILPDNPAFGNLYDFATLVSVYNLARQRYEFQGRVLYTSPQMSDKGLLTQEVVCESYLGFLCDSQQEYVAEQNWTVLDLLQHIIECHNSQLEEYKHFQLGEVNVVDKNDNLYVGIQRENTWETIKKKLIDVLGGEVRFRQVDGVLYLDYVEQLGAHKSTEIALSKNMKSVVKEKNPSAFITRLIPLGAKIKDDGGKETEQRVDIKSVNGGLNYIDDTEAIAVYGLHVGHVEFDGETDPKAEDYDEDEDVSKPSVVLRKGREWLKDNNKVSIKYSITALDLSLIGLDADDFEVFNTYPLRNSLLGINDTGRLHKKVIDVCDDTKTSFDIGESFRSLSELQRDQMVSLHTLSTNVATIIRNYVTNQKLISEINRTTSLIEQTEENIKLSVERDYTKVSDFEDYKESTKSSIELLDDQILTTVAGTYATKTALSETASTLNTAINQKVSASEASITQTVDGKFATKTELGEAKSEMNTVIAQKVSASEASISLSVSGTYATKGELGEYQDATDAKLELKVEKDGENGVVSVLNASADVIDLKAERFKLNSDRLKIEDGVVQVVDKDGARVHISNQFTGVAVESPDYEEGAGGVTFLSHAGVGFISCDKKIYLPILFSSYEAVDGNVYTGFVLDGEWEINRNGSQTAITSDRNRKNTIDAQGDVYSRIFDRLRPVTFKYNDGKSDRLHTGLIAQEVEEAVLAEGLTTKDFAAVCYDVDENGKKTNYAVRYGELVSMCIKEIQDLKAEVARLKQANNVTP